MYYIVWLACRRSTLAADTLRRSPLVGKEMCSDNPNLPKEANKAKCFVIACFVLCASPGAYGEDRQNGHIVGGGHRQFQRHALARLP